MASGHTGNVVPGNRLRVRVPCPPLKTPGFCGVFATSRPAHRAFSDPARDAGGEQVLVEQCGSGRCADSAASSQPPLGSAQPVSASAIAMRRRARPQPRH